MGWILSLILIPILIAEAVATTFVLMVMLNGYPRLPDAMVSIYFIVAIGLIPGLSLPAGFLAQKLAEALAWPLAVVGILIAGVLATLYPISLVVLTFGLLAAFGMV